MKLSKENNLLTANPKICKEWSGKNEIGPENYMPSSNKKVWWACKNNHEWIASVNSRTKKNGNGCPYCAGQKASKENNLLFVNPELCKQWANKNEFGPENYTSGSNQKVWWKCENNHEWKTSIKCRTHKQGCPYCAGKYPTKENNLLFVNSELCKEWDYNKNKLGPESYTPGSHKKTWWVCKNNHEWKATITNRNNGSNCPFCAGKKASKDNNLLLKNQKLCKEWSNKNKSGPENYTPSSEKKVWWTCKNNHEWEDSINHRNNNNRGCPYCSGHRISKENNLLFVNQELCKEWNYNKNELGPENYTSGSNQKVWWKCKNNHEWKATIVNRNNGNGCKKCSKSISKPSQLWLDKLNIQTREFKIPYTNYNVDGYDPKTNTVYEFYGDFWHGNSLVYGRNDTNPIAKKTYGELYDETIKRENIFKLMGYKLITIWESDWNKTNHSHQLS